MCGYPSVLDMVISMHTVPVVWPLLFAGVQQCEVLASLRVAGAAVFKQLWLVPDLGARLVAWIRCATGS